MIRFFDLLKFLFIVFILTSCVNEYNQLINFQLPDNIYSISHYENSNLLQFKVSDEDSSYMVIQKNSSPGGESMWKISFIDNDIYKIQSLENDKYLSVANEYLILQDWQGTDFQIWIIQKYKDEKFKIINKKTNKCLFIEYIQSSESEVKLKKCSNNPREFWKIKLN